MNFFFHPSIHDVRKLPQEVTHIVIDLVETKKTSRYDRLIRF